MTCYRLWVQCIKYSKINIKIYPTFFDHIVLRTKSIVVISISVRQSRHMAANTEKLSHWHKDWRFFGTVYELRNNEDKTFGPIPGHNVISKIDSRIRLRIWIPPLLACSSRSSLTLRRSRRAERRRGRPWSKRWCPCGEEKRTVWEHLCAYQGPLLSLLEIFGCTGYCWIVTNNRLMYTYISSWLG